MKDSKIIQYICSVFFVLGVFFVFLMSHPDKAAISVWDYYSHAALSPDNTISADSIEQNYCTLIWNHHNLIDVNGYAAKCIGMNGYYSDLGMYIDDNGYIISSYNYTSTDYEYRETKYLFDSLSAEGIHFLYINEPTKYLDDSIFSTSFGINSYSNRNADLFLSRLRDSGMNVIDIRDNIRNENLNVSDLFYKTDHHWTVPTGFWTSKIIANALNEYCGYNIDLSLYDMDQYDITVFPSSWLGEQGKKISAAYVGLDDFTLIKPKFETSYTFIEDGIPHDGTFSDFINEDVYYSEDDIYHSGSWHYSYKIINCINHNVNDGKVLLIGDSFAHVTQCFLSLGVHEIDTIILRDYDGSFSLLNYIAENQYDTVIVAYAQFMIGAHDNPLSSNYRMYAFDS